MKREREERECERNNNINHTICRINKCIREQQLEGVKTSKALNIFSISTKHTHTQRIIIKIFYNRYNGVVTDENVIEKQRRRKKNRKHNKPPKTITLFFYLNAIQSSHTQNNKKIICKSRITDVSPWPTIKHNHHLSSQRQQQTHCVITYSPSFHLN